MLTAEELFRRDWPEVASRLGRVLMAASCPVDDVNDLVQEVAVRAMSADNLRAGDVDSFMRWGSTVARRLLIDLVRARAREQQVAEHGDLDARVCVEADVENRLKVQSAFAALKVLSPEQVRALADTPPGADRRTQNRLAVRRRRVREQVRSLGGGLLVVVGAIWRRLRAVAPVLAVPMCAILILGGEGGTSVAESEAGFAGSAPGASVPRRSEQGPAVSVGGAEPTRRVPPTGAAKPAVSVVPGTVSTAKSVTTPIVGPVPAGTVTVRDPQPEDPIACIDRVPGPVRSVCVDNIHLPSTNR